MGGEDKYLDDLVDLVVLPPRLGGGLSPRHHLAFRLFCASVAVGRRSGVGRHVLAIMPLVVGSCGVGLEVAGRRGCPRRGARVWVHGGGLLQVRAGRGRVVTGSEGLGRVK